MTEPPTFADQILGLSLAVAGDEHRRDAERVLASSVAQVVLAQHAWNERTAADVLGAIRRSLRVTPVVRRLVDALVRARLDRDRVGAALERLAADAFCRRHAGALLEVVTVLLIEDDWSKRIAPSWMPVAVGSALGRVWRPLCAATPLIEAWVARFGADESWIRDAVERCPLLLRAKQLPLPVRCALHRAAPTVEGWRFLSHDSSARHVPAWTSTCFGSRADVAVETLERALGEGGEHGARLLLARWLVELVGDTSLR